MAAVNSILQVENLTKSFGDLVLFENISFGLSEGQRVGLIAKNGSGKSTLLNILSGKEGYDGGTISFRRDIRVGYLEQDPQYPEELTVLEACFHHGNSTVELIKEYERCMETEGHPGLDEILVRMDHEKAWEYEQKAKQILSQLKIRDFNQQVKSLSGGQLKRVALANTLITEPDLLILDEPTNHLDLDMTEWLEDYLRRTNLTLLMVTPDRYFLDRVCSEIIEIDTVEEVAVVRHHQQSDARPLLPRPCLLGDNRDRQPPYIPVQGQLQLLSGKTRRAHRSQDRRDRTRQ